MPGESLQRDLAEVLNYYSAEHGSNTPDFILASYLVACLKAFNTASRAREAWYGKALRIGGVLDLEAVEPAPASNAEAGADGEPESSGAHDSSSSSLTPDLLEDR